MRVYFPHDPRLSRAFERIRQAFIKHAPPGTEWVQNPHHDAVHVIHWMGQNPAQHTARDEILFSQPTLPLSSRYVIFLHCPNWPYPQFEDQFRKLVQGALLVVTHTPEFLSFRGTIENCSVHITPWGYDPQTFYKMSVPKRYTILTTGYSAEQEAVDSVIDACYRCSFSVFHVGRLSGYMSPTPTFTSRENVPDHELRLLYSQARFVSGLRREGGFELPLVEGYACGCQPITFDHYGSRRWFRDFAILVPILPQDELTRHLMGILGEKVDVTPRPEILERFQWSKIMREIWEKLG